MFVLSVQDPYFLSFKAPVANIENIQINKLVAYELNTKEIKAKYSAKTWMRYNDKDILKDFKAKTQKEELSSNEAIKKDDIIMLQGDVLYKGPAKDNPTGMKILGQRLYFDNNDKILLSKDPFIALLNKNIIKGKSFTYALGEKTLNIKGVHAWLID